LKAFILEIIKGQRTGIFPSLIRRFLYLLSLAYGVGIKGRNLAYDYKWRGQHPSPVPVTISIGNIVSGGTGKTPVTKMLAKEFYASIPLAILSRGYRSTAEHLNMPVLLSAGNGPLFSAAHCGDEPVLLSRSLPKAYVIVGKNRCKGASMAAKAGAKIILLDDGMQHRRLERDFEVVVMHTSDLFGHGYFLPRGLLRDSVSSLKRAHLIIVNGVRDAIHFKEVQKVLEKYITAPLVAVRNTPNFLHTSQMSKSPDLKGKKVALFCGIAHPEHFKATMIASPIPRKNGHGLNFAMNLIMPQNTIITCKAHAK